MQPSHEKGTRLAHCLWRGPAGTLIQRGHFAARLFAEARAAGSVDRPASFFSFSIDFACFNAARMNFRR
jgi:hypothetical protein